MNAIKDFSPFLIFSRAGQCQWETMECCQFRNVIMVIHSSIIGSLACPSLSSLHLRDIYKYGNQRLRIQHCWRKPPSCKESKCLP